MVDSVPFGRGALNKKHTIIILQWLVVIASSYLMLFSKGQLTGDTRSYALVALFLASGLVFYRLPEPVFHHRFFDVVLFGADTVLISAAIYQNRDAPWDLFLLYFFIIFLAAVGETLLKIIAGFVVISVVYLGFLLQQGKPLAEVAPDFFIRMTFLFGVSILYGYLSEDVRREKVRAEAAEQKERVKMELVAALAHDIKTPLGIIMGYAENLSEQLSSRPGNEDKLQALGRVQENAQRIVNLVTGFLEASKAEAGKLEIERRPVALNPLLEEVARQLDPDIHKKNIELKMRLDAKLPEFFGDTAQLERVFWNLLGNAIKFTPAGGTVTVTSSRQDGAVAVSIRDTGIGIQPDDLPQLFTQFRRLKGAAKVEGTGLGLFIVKTIVEAHRGTVQAESAGGEGSNFTVRIPIRPGR
ncbi:MAG TPA: HAMP domain-containing sensor histidine kinase [Verrucomicrobiae bacterium]|jgi:signal transduction histidine kinase|nr:HAMP domain-containing sensor histidine kinase [Verrucomicrobiae bacterium]